MKSGMCRPCCSSAAIGKTTGVSAGKATDLGPGHLLQQHRIAGPFDRRAPEIAGPGRHVGVMVTDQQPSYAVAVIRSHLALRRHHERAAILAGQQGVGVRMARERLPLGIDAQERAERTACSAPGRRRCRGGDCVILSNVRPDFGVEPGILESLER